MKLACLISGSGRTLQNFIDRRRELGAEIVLVVSSSSTANGVQRARAAGLRVEVVERGPGMSGPITALIDEAAPDLVLLCGFLNLYRFPERWAGRVLNIHPGLLPQFGGRGMYGHHVHEAVLKSGVKESGCTVHYADLEYDRGPTILERRVPVLPGDTPEALAARVFAEECIAYPEAVKKVWAEITSGQGRGPAGRRGT